MVKTFSFLAVAVATISGVLAYSDNCNGASGCNKRMGSECYYSSIRYLNYGPYSSYTSFTNNHCTAIYRCTGAYPTLTGTEIVDLFSHIYGIQGCKGCGSHAFNGGTCEVTYNYCENCIDVIPN
ncbi:hypothetical protein EC991_007208 [Linnemannia zychae]|nr:hypothetical protein EC991_007208 [Linnemannia zychae]